MPLPQSIQARPPGLEYLEELNEVRIQQRRHTLEREYHGSNLSCFYFSKIKLLSFGDHTSLIRLGIF